MARTEPFVLRLPLIYETAALSWYPFIPQRV
jgi:hypothetical protein